MRFRKEVAVFQFKKYMMRRRLREKNLILNVEGNK